MTKLPKTIQFALRSKPAATILGAPTAPGRLPNVTRALAMAIYLEDLVERQEALDYTAVARMRGLSRERVSQLTRLNYLAPDIQVEVLHLPTSPSGKYPISETMLRKIANLLDWRDQRKAWNELKEFHGLVSTPPE